MISQIGIAAGIVFNAGLNLSSLSSSQSIWSMINQFQLLMTLPLVGWYISPEVIEYLQEFQFAILNFSFIPFREVGFIDDYIGNYKGLQQTNLNFETVGLESGSTLVNHFGAFLMILFIILMHLIFTLLKNT